MLLLFTATIICSTATIVHGCIKWFDHSFVVEQIQETVYWIQNAFINDWYIWWFQILAFIFPADSFNGWIYRNKSIGFSLAFYQTIIWINLYRLLRFRFGFDISVCRILFNVNNRNKNCTILLFILSIKISISSHWKNSILGNHMISTENIKFS